MVVLIKREKVLTKRTRNLGDPLPKPLPILRWTENPFRMVRVIFTRQSHCGTWERASWRHCQGGFFDLCMVILCFTRSEVRQGPPKWVSRYPASWWWRYKACLAPSPRPFEQWGFARLGFIRLLSQAGRRHNQVDLQKGKEGLCFFSRSLKK